MKRIVLALSFLFFLVGASVAWPQLTPTQVHDPAALKPPPGARVAIIEFDDMECPMCGQDNPIVKKAAQTYRIPWIRHDFPLRMHVWSFEGAVDARWFDTKSEALGNEFRDAVFANQLYIATKGDLRAFAEKFARQHGIGFPFVVDPQGKLAAEVTADYNLGQRIGIDHTPTMWVVTNKTSGVPYVEVLNINQLYSIIDQALADTKDEVSKPSHTHPSKGR